MTLLASILFSSGWDQPLKAFATKKQWNDCLALQAKVAPYYAKYGPLLTPDYQHVYRALELTSFAATKVVLIGQDPYPDQDKATGLAFSVGNMPNWYRDSLIAITDLLASDGCGTLLSGNLTNWAQQGVLLLNMYLNHRNTSEKHLKPVDTTLPWSALTQLMIEALNARSEPVIFVLWGNAALEVESLITAPQHTIIRASHPSKMSRQRTLRNGTIPAFVNSQSFKKINAAMAANGQAPIHWC